MKNVLSILLILISICQESFSQELETCQKIVNLTIESINNQSKAELEEHLAPDFSMAGHEGEIAKMILSQLLTQLDETVLSANMISDNKTDSGLELKYNIEYERKGAKQATFLFNDQNLLQELHLFKMQVKKMSERSDVTMGSSDVITIPFKLAGNLIVVAVQLNTVTRNFILDTGCPRVILNARYISSGDTTQQRLSSVKGVGGKIAGLDIQELESLDFGGIQMNSQDILTLDLTHLEEGLEQDIYGLIGFEMIKDYDLLFDYQEQVLTLIKPEVFETFKNNNFANKELTTLQLSLRGHIPVVEGSINNQTFNLGIDSGAESNLIDDGLYKSLKKSTKNQSTDELIGADNNSRTVNTGDIKRMTLGNKTFKLLPTVYSDISHLNKANKLNIDGLIGFPILSRQKTLISFERKELVFIE